MIKLTAYRNDEVIGWIRDFAELPDETPIIAIPRIGTITPNLFATTDDATNALYAPTRA